jgi:hypothetical protein
MTVLAVSGGNYKDSWRCSALSAEEKRRSENKGQIDGCGNDAELYENGRCEFI